MLCAIEQDRSIALYSPHRPRGASGGKLPYASCAYKEPAAVFLLSGSLIHPISFCIRTISGLDTITKSSYCSVPLRGFRSGWHLPVFWGCRDFTEPSLSATLNKRFPFYPLAAGNTFLPLSLLTFKHTTEFRPRQEKLLLLCSQCLEQVK